MMIRFAWLLILFTAAIPTMAGESHDFHKQFADKIGKAHGIEAYRSHAALQADITVLFGGATMLQGTVTFDTPVGQSRIETNDGVVMVLDGQDAWVAPGDAPIPPGMARFHLLTWPYFIAAPFKLADPGTHMKDAGMTTLVEDRSLPAGKLTFAPDTGDAPDDWYIVYRDKANDRLAALAYIVTYGNTKEAAEEEPHAAAYEAVEQIDGVAVPTKLSFWNWSPDKGLVGEQIGSLELTNIRFVTPDEDTFTKPEGAHLDAPASASKED